MRIEPDFPKLVSRFQSTNATLIERFGRLSPIQRGRILDEEMKDYDDIFQVQKKRNDNSCTK